MNNFTKALAKRLRNYVFLVAIAAFVLKILTGEHIVTDLVAQRYEGYFQDLLNLLVLAGIVVNPVTKGLRDRTNELK